MIASVKCRRVEFSVGARKLNGILRVPQVAKSIVVFAHGSGRYSPRNQFVARILEQGGMATLLLDLLDEDEADDRAKVFDVEMLADRLQIAAHRLRQESETRTLRLGYFGAGAGAAAALIAAARNPDAVEAVVCRGGQLDLADSYLAAIQAPTLLVVGANDREIVEANERARLRLRCRKELIVIPGASHFFEEPATLEEVAELAKAWFARYLAR